MDLEDYQIEELELNYELEEETILEYLHKILKKLKAYHINNIDKQELYECLELCCQKASSNEFNREYSIFGAEESDYRSMIIEEDEIVEGVIKEHFSRYLDSVGELLIKK